MGRGVGRIGTDWRRALAVVVLIAGGLLRPASAEDTGGGVGPAIPVPSGQEVHWIDSIRDTQGPAGLTLRFRFLAPQIGGDTPIDPEVASADMQALCDGWVMQRLPNTGPRPAQIVISLSDRVVPFGETDEAAVQFFEAYSVEDGACVWEMF